jgi:hypothetical protein
MMRDGKTRLPRRTNAENQVCHAARTASRNVFIPKSAVLIRIIPEGICARIHAPAEKRMNSAADLILNAKQDSHAITEIALSAEKKENLAVKEDRLVQWTDLRAIAENA